MRTLQNTIAQQWGPPGGPGGPPPGMMGPHGPHMGPGGPHGPGMPPGGPPGSHAMGPQPPQVNMIFSFQINQHPKQQILLEFILKYISIII